MNKTIVGVLTTILVIIVLSAVRISLDKKAEPAPIGYSEMTKQQYLDKLTAKGYGEFEQCFYSQVIDLIGVQEVIKLDAKIFADEANAEQYYTPEMRDIIATCAEEEL